MTKLIKPIRLTLNVDTAEELMSPNPISSRGDASVHDAIVLLTDVLVTEFVVACNK